jgi:glycosyltransferase involved in cell wall biosynthesis
MREEESEFYTFNENKRFIFMNKQFYNNKKYKKEFQLITNFQSYIYLIKNCQLTKYLYYLIFVIIIMISLILFNKIYNSSRRNESKTLFNTKYLVQNYTKLSDNNNSSINNNDSLIGEFFNILPRTNLKDNNSLLTLKNIFQSNQLFISDANITNEYLHFIRPINEDEEKNYNQKLYENIIPNITENKTYVYNFKDYYTLCNGGRLITSEKFEYSNEPLISIIVPSYNKENEILKSIRSIQNQSLKNIEIIIVDDCSIDNSKDIYKYLLEADPRIRVFRHLKNMGVWRSRLDGFLYSRAKYIIHFDMGDLYINNFVLEDYYNIISKYKLDSIRFSSYTYNNKSDPFNYNHVKFNDFELKISYEKRNFDITTFEYGTIWNRLIRANVITKGLYLLDSIIFNAYKNMWEDRWWNTLVNKFGNSYVMINRPGYFYLISFDGEGTMKKGNATMNDKCIREFIYFWVFDLKLLPKEDNKDSIINTLHTFNQSYNEYLGSPIHLDFISTRFPVYEYFLNLLLNDEFVSNKNKDFIRILYKNYLNQVNKL